MKYILLTLIFILSIPVALISFFCAIQKNAWRFGRELLKNAIRKEGKDPFS